MPSLQITCSAEFKADVDALARACGYDNTSDFLRPFVERLVEANQKKIFLYRKLISTPPVEPKAKLQAGKKKSATEPAQIDDANTGDAATEEA